ncbi:VQ motif-containing protein 19 [Hibiscus syriacus]|uniref:VQ motif-containing protein 19 n=1 Tax=Hibiscus syriacus TaxID=106335 RepID=A0A6A3CSF2_HIBSY|nr:VQ motif-containing protein 4-like [Hibiscus syriacus]KAE8732153.1 VQ motif-containing protein 19 [Hibiscus syriacus]
MENSTRLLQENMNFPSSSPLNSPHSNGTINNGSAQIHTPPLTPIPTRSETTTFVQADTTTFKQVVQMLTGTSETAKQDPSSLSKSSFPVPPMKTTPPKKQSFKLYERRKSNLKNSCLMINTFVPPNVGSNIGAEILSPSLLDLPKLTLSPVTPLNEDHFNKSSPSLRNSSSEEEKAIAEKGFYLHPSPMSTPRDAEPQLLPLFPLTSPRI